MNTISAMMHRALCAKEQYPALAIDGTPIYEWLRSQVFDGNGNDQTGSLVPAQVWLVDDDEARNAWKLLSPYDDTSTVVPLLVSPDDRDLSCKVVVVEQIVDAKCVIWQRFGVATNAICGVVTSVAWSRASQSAEFDRKQFEEAYNEFRRLSPDIWREGET